MMPTCLKGFVNIIGKTNHQCLELEDEILKEIGGSAANKHIRAAHATVDAKL